MSNFEYAVIMPKMSMTMEEGELLSLRVGVGDAVKSGDVLFDVATDKIDMEVESPADGVVKEIVGQVGSTMIVGAPVLILLTETQVMSFDFNTPSPAPVAEIPVEVEAPKPMPPIPAIVPDQVRTVETIKAIPKAREVAKSKGIDLSTVTPSGPFGTITYEDISRLHFDGGNDARRAANRKMVASAIEKTRTIPQITLSRFSSHTTSSIEQGSAHLLSTWASILRRNPHVNISTITEEPHSVVGVALIMESIYGLALPVFADPDLGHGIDLSVWIQETREKASRGKVPLEMLSGATASVFDVSHTHINSVIPLLLPSHTTALSVGAPYSSFGQSEISLTVDLRYCDALEAAALLDQLINSL
jgi:pyruvate dehydrogenase E2 component (dihydrolipoamide acetyltransferase)